MLRFLQVKNQTLHLLYKEIYKQKNNIIHANSFNYQAKTSDLPGRHNGQGQKIVAVTGSPK